MQDYEKLDVWKEAHTLTLDVYRSTKSFPVDERFGLTQQIRRAAASVPANIAEGCGRSHQREMAQFLNISLGSVSELHYHLRLAADLGFISGDVHAPLDARARRIRRMLTALHQRVLGASARP